MTTDNLVATVEAALAALAADDQAVTFTAVAHRGGVARAPSTATRPCAPSSINTAATRSTPTPSAVSTPRSLTSAPRSKPSPAASATTRNASATSNAAEPPALPDLTDIEATVAKRRARLAGQCIRQRAGGDNERPVQGRVRLRARQPRLLGRCRRPRARHPLMGALVQRAAAAQPLRRCAARRVRSSVLRCPTGRPHRGWKPTARVSIRPRAVQPAAPPRSGRSPSALPDTRTKTAPAAPSRSASPSVCSPPGDTRPTRSRSHHRR